MTRKDYEAIAKAINKSATVEDSMNCLVNELTILFTLDNSRFDPVRFRDACGVQDWVR